jgi:hypothetical protein
VLILSVDLGQVNDYTAAVVLEASGAGPGGRSSFVGFLRRWRGVPYPETVRRVAEVAAQPAVRSAVLVLDMGGVGRPVVDAVRAALPGRVVYGLTLTHGQRVTAGQGPLDANVPKKGVITAAQMAIQADPKRLTFARELPDRTALEDELANYRVRITEHLNETFAAARETDHDDIVLAVAMGCWVADHLPGDLPPADQLVLNPLPGDAPEPDRPRSRMEQIAADLPHVFGGE